MTRIHFVLLLLWTTSLHAGDWPQWRGPTNDGKAAPDQNPPIRFSSNQNVIWKTELPSRGHASPTIVGDRIFLATADGEKKTQSVIGIDRASGRILWERVVFTGGLPRKIHSKNTHASGTIASDGKRIFGAFYNSDALQVVALDFNGKILWKRNAGKYAPRKYEFGYGASPTVHNGLVIVAAEYEGGGFIAGLKAATGDIVWRAKRPKQPSFSSPIVGKMAGREQLVISGCKLMESYDPATGKKLWTIPATSPATCGTVVWDGDLVFASGGYPNKETVAVKADGSGKIAWKNSEKCYEQSMLAHKGYVYAVSDQGVAFCWRAKDGEEMWRHRLGGAVSASPILVGNRIYAANERGKFFVFAASPDDFELFAENQLGDESFATPSFCDGRIYIRVAYKERGKRREVLYCFGE